MRINRWLADFLRFWPSSRWAGDKYVGEFRDDKMHGQCTEYLANGNVGRTGLWRDNQFVGTSMVQPSQTIPTNQVATGSAVRLIREGGAVIPPESQGVHK